MKRAYSDKQNKPLPLVFFPRCPENIDSLRAGLLTHASPLERLPVFTVAVCSLSAFTVVAAVEALHLASLLRQLGCRPESIQLYVHENSVFHGFSGYPHIGSDYSKSLPCCQEGQGASKRGCSAAEVFSLAYPRSFSAQAAYFATFPSVSARFSPCARI